MDILYEIEGITNDRLRQEASEIFLVTKEDCVSGPGSSVIMPALTHNKQYRYTYGIYGINYDG